MTCGFFCWLGLERLYGYLKKNFSYFSILVTINKEVHFFIFFNTKYAQRWTWNLYYPRKPHEFFFTIWKPYKGSFQDQCQNTRTLAGFQSFLTKFARISKMTKMTKIKFEYLQPKFSWLHKFLGEILPWYGVSKTNSWIFFLICIPAQLTYHLKIEKTHFFWLFCSYCLQILHEGCHWP